MNLDFPLPRPGYQQRQPHRRECRHLGIIQNATRQAQEREEAIVHEAQEKAARTMERAHAQVEREKKQAMNDLKDQVSGMAIGIASAVLEEDVDKRKHAKLIDSFIENLGEPL